jgi:Icc-related predicted phosphoesterase
MAAVGYYTAIFNEDEYEQLTSVQRTSILENLICRRMTDWLEFATDKLKNTDIKICAIAGNDDLPNLDSVLENSSVVAFADGHVVELGNDLQVLGYGFSTPTPWHTYREQTDVEMKSALERLSEFLDRGKGTIFHLHVPPFGSGLDLAPKLDSELRPIMSSSGPVMEPVGSQAVADLVKEYQPLVGLFGHVHESRSVTSIGETLCANPGSAYSEGRLLGFIAEVANQKVIDWQLTEG